MSLYVCSLTNVTGTEVCFWCVILERLWDYGISYPLLRKQKHFSPKQQLQIKSWGWVTTWANRDGNIPLTICSLLRNTKYRHNMTFKIDPEVQHSQFFWRWQKVYELWSHALRRHIKTLALTDIKVPNTFGYFLQLGWIAFVYLSLYFSCTEKQSYCSLGWNYLQHLFNYTLSIRSLAS